MTFTSSQSSPISRPILEVQKISGGYTAEPIVKDIFLELQQGEWLSLVGANGSGKSTLLRLLSRVLQPQGGIVLLDGKSIHHQPAKQVARQLAMLPQQQTVPEGLTVEQLVALGRTPHQEWWQWELNGDDREIVDRSLIQTQLAHYRDRSVEELSGGERQRAFLALALAQQPKVLLLDEPTTYLDIHYQLELLELIRQLNQDHQLTVVTVLHELNLAARYSDRIALLKEGCLWAIGASMEVLTPANLREVFHIEATLVETPIGLQMCALRSLH
ncbi:ABC transporter ATP-binding protein [Alkalinema pantanalense CENA528]|uniref:ABC transporter ATP-binding protein n=1 Tax=Alkalinema pantanalense TaxID=1620705 RepID=UPI003D6E930D